MKNIDSLIGMMKRVATRQTKFFQLVNDDDITLVTNGYMILISDEQSKKYEVEDKGLDLYKTIGCIDSMLAETGYKELDAPSIEGLRDAIDEVSGGSNISLVRYSFGEVVVNARYLLATLECLGECIRVEYINHKSPIRIYNDDKTVYILPIYFKPEDILEEGSVW